MRACENFPFTNRAMPESMIRAYGAIKSAALTTAKELKLWKDRPEVADALIVAVTELSSGALSSSVIVPAMQGGASKLYITEIDQEYPSDTFSLK